MDTLQTHLSSLWLKSSIVPFFFFFQMTVHLSILLESGLYFPVSDRKAGPPARRPDRGTVRSRRGTEPRWPRSSRRSPEPACASVDRQLTETETEGGDGCV